VHNILCLIKVFTFQVSLDGRSSFVKNGHSIGSVAEKDIRLILVMSDGIINMKFKQVVSGLLNGIIENGTSHVP
jgi:hypothetical protein